MNQHQQQPQYQMTPPPPTTPHKGRSNAVALIMAIGVAFVPAIFIFGIIAAIAIPNFQRFKAKASQSEAKALLSMAYSGEKGFIAEWAVATTDLEAMGVAFDEGAKARYHIGFAQPAVAQWDTIGIEGPHDPSKSDTEKLGRRLDTDLGAPFAELAAKYCPDCTAVGESFKIVAIGNVDSDPDLDVWTIDQDRQLLHVEDDLK